MALASGIPVGVWAREDPRTVATAFDLLRGKQTRNEDAAWPPMSG